MGVTTNLCYRHNDRAYQVFGDADPDIRGRMVCVLSENVPFKAGANEVAKIVSRYGVGPRGGDKRYFDVETKTGRTFTMDTMGEAVAEALLDTDKLPVLGISRTWFNERMELRRRYNETREERKARRKAARTASA